MQPKVTLQAYDWIVLNSSGGKDSQTMIEEVVSRCDRESIERAKLVVVHCDLGEVEWNGTKELAHSQAQHYGLRFEVVQRKQGSILDHVLQRRLALDRDGKHSQPAWPSSTARWCTSDHKRGQVTRLFTQLTAETRQSHPGKRVRILNCMGMRKAESNARSKLKPFCLNKATNGKRTVHTWLPIFDLSGEEVWGRVKASGVQYHYAYDLGMPRLSCCFCIFAPRNALILAGRHNPELLAKYVAVEELARSTFRVNLSLADVQRDIKNGVDPGEISTWEM